MAGKPGQPPTAAAVAAKQSHIHFHFITRTRHAPTGLQRCTLEKPRLKSQGSAIKRQPPNPTTFSFDSGHGPFPDCRIGGWLPYGDSMALSSLAGAANRGIASKHRRHVPTFCNTLHPSNPKKWHLSCCNLAVVKQPFGTLYVYLCLCAKLCEHTAACMFLTPWLLFGSNSPKCRIVVRGAGVEVPGYCRRVTPST